MDARGPGGRLLVGLTVTFVLAGAGPAPVRPGPRRRLDADRARHVRPHADTDRHDDEERRLRVGQPGADAGRARRLRAGQGRPVARGRDVPRRRQRPARIAT